MDITIFLPNQPNLVTTVDWMLPQYDSETLLEQFLLPELPVRAHKFILCVSEEQGVHMLKIIGWIPVASVNNIATYHAMVQLM